MVDMSQHTDSTQFRRALQMKRNLRIEIDEVKTKVRTAYTLEVQVNVEDYKPTPEEEEIMNERTFNMKYLEKLEKVYYSGERHKNGDTIGHVYRENLSLIHFFYLILLTQQGYLYTITKTYPTLEPEALIYLCDKLITASLYAERLNYPFEKKAYRAITFELMRNIIEEKDIPVADGFKTTYKQIMSICRDLIYKSINPLKDPVDNAASQSERQIPPMWVVMPNQGLMGNKTFTLPNAVPYLPFPAQMLSTINTPTTVFPDPLESMKKDIERKKKSILLWKNRNRRSTQHETKVDESKKNEVKEGQAEENVAKENQVEENKAKENQVEENEPKENHFEDNKTKENQFEDNELKEDEKENGTKKQVTQTNQAEEEDEDEEEYEDYEDYARDRFADADTTDSEDEEEKQVVTKDKPVEATKETTINDKVAKEKTTPVVTTENISSPKTEEPDKAISNWLNFAASSPKKDNKNKV